MKVVLRNDCYSSLFVLHKPWHSELDLLSSAWSMPRALVVITR